MAFFDISDASYNENLRMLETTDRAHADVFNALYGQLIRNDVALKDAVDHAGAGAAGTTAEVQAIIDGVLGDSEMHGGEIPDSDIATDDEIQELIDGFFD